MKTKKISELTMLENKTETTNIVVEDNGETKRIPASSVLFVSDMKTIVDAVIEGLPSAEGGSY